MALPILLCKAAYSEAADGRFAPGSMLYFVLKGDEGEATVAANKFIDYVADHAAEAKKMWGRSHSPVGPSTHSSADGRGPNIHRGGGSEVGLFNGTSTGVRDSRA